MNLKSEKMENFEKYEWVWGNYSKKIYIFGYCSSYQFSEKFQKILTSNKKVRKYITKNICHLKNIFVKLLWILISKRLELDLRCSGQTNWKLENFENFRKILMGLTRWFWAYICIGVMQQIPIFANFHQFFD